MRIPPLYIAVLFPVILCQALSSCGEQAYSESREMKIAGLNQTIAKDSIIEDSIVAVLDTSLFNQKLSYLVHHAPSEKWPVKTEYPLSGALLPFNRIVAYYGNLYSKGMGILGALPPEQMLKRLMGEVEKWEKADSSTTVIPALHYVAVTAQPEPGASKKYRLRMPSHQIDRVLELAGQIDAIVFLDIQPGHSTLQSEIPALEKYLKLPNVHLGVDPEYSMKSGKVPCQAIGTLDAADINYASEYLAQLVKENNIPPKVLVIHRFTKGMVTNYQKIKTRPEVQIVMHMDGFGYPEKKINTYKNAITAEPVEFTGFKLFYKNDVADPRWPNLMTPEKILELYPRPVYIQYQ